MLVMKIIGPALLERALNCIMRRKRVLQESDERVITGFPEQLHEPDRKTDLRAVELK